MKTKKDSLNIDLANLKDDELIAVYAGTVRQLRERKIIRTKNILGDLGERIAINFFNSKSGLPNLQDAPIGTQNIDAISRNGERYSIKSTTGATTGVFYGLPEKDSTEIPMQKFEYVLIVKFNENYELEKIIQIDWKTFLKYKKWHSTMKAWNLTLTNALIKDAEIIFHQQA